MTTTIGEKKEHCQFFLDEKDVCYRVKTNYLKRDGRKFDLEDTLLLAVPFVAALLFLLIR